MPGISSQYTFDTEISDKIDNLVQGVATEVYDRLVMRTPVDTGYAQSRWELAYGHDDFEVYNDCEYISYLEDGHSKQAPHGFLAITMNEIDRIIEDQAARTTK